jgi:PAS domain S-box-containing protein
MDDALQILLVDDDDIDRMAVRRALRAAGLAATVTEAASRADALPLMQARPFDCVLLDYRLADADGLAVLRDARAAGVKSPVIMLTGQGDEELAVEIMKAGASDYLTKSRVSLDHLVQSVRSAVRLHRAEEQAAAATARVAESEERYRSLVYTTSQIIWTTDAHGNVVSALPTWTTFTGQTDDQARGQGWLDAIHPDDRQLVRQSWAGAVEARAVYEAEYRLRRHDGAYRYFIARGAPVIGAGGAVREWVGTCTDITDRIEAENERARLLAHERAARAEAEAVQHRLAFLAEASKVLSASLNYEQALATVAQLAVRRISDWCAVDVLVTGPTDDKIRRLAVAHADPQKARAAAMLREKYAPLLTDPNGVAHVLRGGVPELRPDVTEEMLAAAARDREHLRVLHELGICSAMLVPLKTRGQVLGVISFLAAESGRHFTSADLALAEDLARRAAIAVDNAQLYRTLREAKDAAVAANRAKDQFLAVLSHELRTPLTPVLTTVQDLERDPDLSDDLRCALRMVRRNVELEAKLIDDLLDLTRISKGKMPLTLATVDAHALLNSVLEICEGDIVNKRQRVSVELGARCHHVRADSARLQQIFWNLIKNAVKFTPEEGEITVRTSNDDGGNVQVQVVDTGIGIEPEVMPRIFDAFEQGEQAVTRQFGGLGLGLAITRALVEAHGGYIRAESAGRGAGATFTAGFPTVAPQPAVVLARPHRSSRSTKSAAAAAKHAAAQQAQQVPAHLKILLVDDHEDTSRAMKRLLERIGYEVHTASSVAGALESAHRDPFDLLISDIGLPDGSGHELVRRLRQNLNQDRPLKAIALSGFGMEEDLRKSREAGFVEHLTKPVNFSQLEAVIQQLTT